MNFVKSKIFDLIVVVVFFLLAGAEGKVYPIAGVAGVIWLTIVALRYFIDQEPKRI